MANGDRAGALRRPCRLAALPPEETLSASRLRNRSFRALKLAPCFGHDRAAWIRKNQVFEVLNRVPALSLSQQQPSPFELRGRRRRALPTAPHDLIEQRKRGPLLNGPEPPRHPSRH